MSPCNGYFAKVGPSEEHREVSPESQEHGRKLLEGLCQSTDTVEPELKALSL